MGGLDFCLQCKQYIPKEEIKDELPLVMPPRIYEITEKLWKITAPWPLIPFHLVEKYGWYVSYLNSHQYLIMPIWRNGSAAYYSARLLDADPQALKYQYPKGVKKLYWISSDELASPVIITEGVADGVYCSQFGSSVAVLGSYYNNSLDDLLTGKHIVLCFDADAPGMVAAMRIATQLKVAKTVKLIVLPYKKDPTDLEPSKLKEFIVNV
jgi:DNA primase